MLVQNSVNKLSKILHPVSLFFIYNWSHQNNIKILIYYNFSLIIYIALQMQPKVRQSIADERNLFTLRNTKESRQFPKL